MSAGMFRLATCDFRNRNVLLVEADQQTACMISASIYSAGGRVAGFACTVPDAVEMAGRVPADLVVLDIRYVGTVSLTIQELFRPLDIEVGLLVFDDDWYNTDDETTSLMEVDNGNIEPASGSSPPGDRCAPGTNR